MNNFEQRKLELIQDINRVIGAIDDEVDTFIVSRMHPNQLVRKIANEAFEKKKEKTIAVTNEMIKKL